LKVRVEQWALIKSGELNGFSLDGCGIREDAVYELTIPDLIQGKTMPAEDGHEHDFVVKYDNAGNFIGGVTTAAPDGHFHYIVKGTVTENAGSKSHNHRFSYIEGIIDARVAA
jgi:hypothetical protein